MPRSDRSGRARYEPEPRDRRNYAVAAMAAGSTPSSKAITPPKGRPTRGRRGRRAQRTFGSTFQWIAATALLTLVLVAGFLLLD